MSNPPIRFSTLPSELGIKIAHPPFEVWCGMVEAPGRRILAAVWRRAGTTLEYEPTSAEFVRDVVRPKFRNPEFPVEMPSHDGELDAALAALVKA
jgi:hypothetical protein